jgi:hypothetical protein
MSFLSPTLLAFTALASVPIIIHLLNRRRFMRVDWAPMKYLKLTIKNNRRRLRVEQLILLAVRTLVILLLIFAVARPVLSSTGLGSWLGGQSRTSRILVIDDSLSMGYRVDRRSALDAGKDAIREIARHIGAQDAVTAFTTSAPQDRIIREVHLENPGTLLGEIEKLKVTDTTSDWPATFKAIDASLAAAAFPHKEVTIVTDLRKSGWGTGVGEIANRWQAAGIAVRIVDVGTKATSNVALTGFEFEDPIVLAGEQAKIKASIRNDSTNAVTGAQAVLTVGDVSRPILLPDLPPGRVTEVPLAIDAAKPGQIAVKLDLPNDSLPADNVRWLAMDVRSSLDVQLVDGQPSPQPFEGASDFLQNAFISGPQPWRVDKRSDQEWVSAPLAPADVIVLANVASLSRQRIEAIERAVRNGTGLMIFAGENVDPAVYNGRLYRDGNGLLPAKLDRPIETPVTGLVVEALAQSPLAPLSKIAPEALARVKARKFLAASVPAKNESVRVLAKWNDPEGHPAVIEKRFGKGRVLLWTISANREWSDWPIDPTYVLAVRSAVAAIARAQPQQDNLAAGQPIEYQLEEGQAASEAKVTTSGREGAELGVVEKRPGGSIIRATQTYFAGPYVLSWKDATGKPMQHLYCVSGDKAESDLTPLEDSDLRGLLDRLRVTIVHYNAAGSALAQNGKEIWRTFAVAVLALLAVETVLAVWVGRER